MVNNSGLTFNNQQWLITFNNDNNWLIRSGELFLNYRLMYHWMVSGGGSGLQVEQTHEPLRGKGILLVPLHCCALASMCLIVVPHWCHYGPLTNLITGYSCQTARSMIPWSKLDMGQLDRGSKMANSFPVQADIQMNGGKWMADIIPDRPDHGIWLVGITIPKLLTLLKSLTPWAPAVAKTSKGPNSTTETPLISNAATHLAHTCTTRLNESVGSLKLVGGFKPCVLSIGQPTIC